MIWHCQWYHNYLKDQWFKVTVDGSFSSEKIMNFSVPQGSLPGSVLFNCYCSTLWDIIFTNIDLNGYADGHTLQKNFKPNTEQEKIIENYYWKMHVWCGVLDERKQTETES